MILSLDRARAAPKGKNGPLTFIGATGGKKADGIDLGDGLPWDFSRGVGGGAGPRFPFLWVHDLIGKNLPLGVADVLTKPEDVPLRVAVTFDPEDQLAMRVRAKYLSPVGGLLGVSISWDTVGDDGVPVRATGKRAVARQLLEVSAVPVGMDPGALLESHADAIRNLRDDLDAWLHAPKAKRANVFTFDDLGAWLDARLERQRLLDDLRGDLRALRTG